MVTDMNLPNVRKWDERLLFIRDVDAGTRAPACSSSTFDEFEARYWQFTPSASRATSRSRPTTRSASTRVPDKALRRSTSTTG
jgi:hypothetical protein